MSDRTLWRLWGISLMAGGVCTLALAVLNIMGSGLAKTLTPILSILIIFATVGILITTAQIQKRRKK